MTIYEALAELPTTPDNIGWFLLQRNIKGVRKDPQKCPIAHWLYFRSSQFREEKPIVRAFGAINRDVRCMDWSFPQHVVNFILQFDKKHYPQLVVYSWEFKFRTGILIPEMTTEYA
jgi:hypothetical protein